jgi:hypothetical protein
VAYAVPNQEELAVAEDLVTIFFCCFGVMRGLLSDQGHNFESRLLQVLQRLGVSKTHTTPLHPQLDSMKKLYIRVKNGRGTLAIHHYARQHVKLASDRMKAHYGRLANSAGFQEGD